ncbi:TetR family transcriptional regulator [Paenibacillus yonginensis]|uniref:TetR family transcriptional regulator n=1 Tax=Paenibacillus yonginensis TaxID=1462996 RepID=A0A1B1N5R7_9BACL|nr:TetR family transcriptional regulator [Paenibacillus yonginensis]ANS76780.1 TetR family transcriptional regulator [Paenibacillus yonginensis]
MNKKAATLTKTDILDAAETALRKYGPDKTSVTDVAKLLGVSHGTLYRHYESKAALKEAVTERWLDQMISQPLLQLSQDRAQVVYIPDLLKAYIQRLFQMKREFSLHDSEMFKMYAEVTEAAVDLIAEHISQICGHLAAIVQAGIDKGQIRPGEPDKLARALFHATARFHHPAHAYEWKEPGIDNDFEQVWGLLAEGFKR